jgi:DHA1 family tetracycline resistance protein-like MFS transporter
MNRRPSVLFIFLTVFIDLVGFGVIVPLVPLYSRDFGAHGIVIGLIFASYSAMQFIFSPIWGRMSDRHGRRPILLLSTAGACLSYVLFAVSSGLQNHTTALWLMIVSRLFAGMCGGNITVAQAYIADITPPEKRSKMMGLIGMAFGLGFIFGPIFGGVGLKYFGLTGPGWIAAAFCAANFIFAFSILAESLRPGSEHVRPRPHLDQWIHTLTRPKVGLLVMVFFLATFCFSCFESTLPLLVSDHFHLNIEGTDAAQASTIVYLFAFCGIIGAFVQGGTIGRLVKMLGEPKLIAVSLVLTGISLALLPYLSGTTPFSWSGLFHAAGWPWVKLLFALALLSVGTSLTRPPVFGLISNLTPATEQGATIGVAQGTGSLARIVGPVYATALYAHHPALPYVTCGILAAGTGLLVAQRLTRHAPDLASEPAKAAS